jgi:hypothetical protein
MTCRQWIDLSWDGTGHRRSPNGTLGSLIRFHYPGVVTIKGVQKVVTSWDDFKNIPHCRYENLAGAVWNDFWVRTVFFLFLFDRCYI